MTVRLRWNFVQPKFTFYFRRTHNKNSLEKLEPVNRIDKPGYSTISTTMVCFYTVSRIFLFDVLPNWSLVIYLPAILHYVIISRCFTDERRLQHAVESGDVDLGKKFSSVMCFCKLGVDKISLIAQNNGLLVLAIPITGVIVLPSCGFWKFHLHGVKEFHSRM